MFANRALRVFALNLNPPFRFDRPKFPSNILSQNYAADHHKPAVPPLNSKLGRHMYHDDSEKAINDQIGAELGACYAYLALAAHFGRNEVALPGCFAFFHQMHLEELGHAHKLMRYQNMRGGQVILGDLKAPFQNTLDLNIEKSFATGLQMEKDVKEKLICVHDVAEKHHDLNMMDFIVTEFMLVQEKSIQEYARLLHRYTSMKGCGTCSCVDLLFDKELHNVFSRGASDDDVTLTPDEKEFK